MGRTPEQLASRPSWFSRVRFLGMGFAIGGGGWPWCRMMSCIVLGINVLRSIVVTMDYSQKIDEEHIDLNKAIIDQHNRQYSIQIPRDSPH